MICDYSQVTDDVLDFLPFKETCATADGVGNVCFKESFFNGTGLGVCTDQDAKVSIVSFFFSTDSLNSLCNEICFCSFIFRHVDFNRFSSAVSAPKFLVLAVGVVFYDTIGSRKNCTCGSVVLFKSDFLKFRKIILKVYDVLVVCTTPAVDALVIVANYGYISFCKEVHEFILLVACVLEFIYHYVLEPFLVSLKNFGMGLEEGNGQNDKIVKIYGIVKL